MLWDSTKGCVLRPQVFASSSHCTALVLNWCWLNSWIGSAMEDFKPESSQNPTTPGHVQQWQGTEISNISDRHAPFCSFLCLFAIFGEFVGNFGRVFAILFQVLCHTNSRGNPSLCWLGGGGNGAQQKMGTNILWTNWRFRRICWRAATL